MKLIVTEKPSVAMSYAKVLGVQGRQDGYLEGNGYLVSWCVGHLVELAPPSAYGEQYVKWNIDDLPILPQKWQYLVSASTKKQFAVLKKLMHRADVETVVRESLSSGWSMNKPNVKSLFHGCGFPVWRTTPFVRALRTSDRQLNTMHCIRLHCAGSAPIGKSASTAPGFFHACMVVRWR